MNFWKEHTNLRILFILGFFVAGLILVFTGWAQTGQLGGLIQMMFGVVLLLAALFIYNKPFQDPKKKK